MGAAAGDGLAGFVDAALAPYLLGGVSGLAAGLMARRLLRRRPATAVPPHPPQAPQWRDFVEVSGDWLWEIDAELRFVAVPDAPPAPSIAPEGVVGRSWKEVVMPDLPAEFALALEATMARHGPMAATLPRRTQGGELRYLELKGRPMFDAGGHFSGYRGIGREVTEQARLAADLERSEERTVALLAYAHDGYWEQDADLRYTTLNASSGHLADLAAEDLIGSRRWELPEVSPTAEPWAAHIERLRQIEPFSDFLFRRVNAQGRPVWLVESGIPIFDRRGVFAGYCGTTRNVTAEIESRQKLVQDEALFRRIFEHAPVGVAQIDANGRLTQVNQALAAMLGQAADRLIGQPADGALAEDDVAAGMAFRQRGLTGEAPVLTREMIYRRADGQRGWCHEALSRIDGPEGGNANLLLVRQDITALRATVANHEAAGRRYEALFEHSPEATLVVVGGQIRMANAACRKLFGGAETTRLEGIELLGLTHPDDREMEAARLAELDADARLRRLPPLPLRYRRLDGETINTEATGVRIDFNGRPALLYVLRDVTRWLLAEQVLRESQAMYRDVVESVNEILFQTDAGGRISFLNRAWRNTTGFDTRLTIGQNLLDFVVEDDRGRVGHCLGAIREGYEEIGQFEFRLRTQASGPRWVEATIRPLRNAYDNVVGSSGTLDDITARKEAEQTQRNLNRELEARVRVRTAELEASNRELEAFSYSVSHDLRAPLRAIDGFAQIVAEDYAPRLDDIGREYLQRIRVATQRMARLIDDLIDLARLTRQSMHRETVNLSQVVEQILGELHQEEPDRRVETSVEPGLVAAADRALIRVALDNLLRNAWKFTSRRDIAQIRFHAEMRDRQIVYCVSDNGAGFDMSFASKLFLPFHRLHGISEFEGTGIGLATVQRVIQRHEGKVWAESTPDEGASFFFTLNH